MKRSYFVILFFLFLLPALFLSPLVSMAQHTTWTRPALPYETGNWVIDNTRVIYDDYGYEIGRIVPAVPPWHHLFGKVWILQDPYGNEITRIWDTP